MRPAEVLRRAAGYLDRHGVPSPLPSAEVLLAQVLGTDRAGLYARNEGLTTAQAKRFGRALCQRCAGVPLQHLTGEQGFRRLTVTVRPGVFVPRPETEILVEHALAAIGDVPAPVVVDVGTGTGAIALAIKDERPDARVFATDRSGEAVALATRNAAALGLDVEVFEGDLLEPLPAELRGAIDLVVSNPPYVEPSELATLPPDVRADPRLALEGGLDLMVRLLVAASACLRPGGTVAIEIDESKGAAVRDAVGSAGFADARIEPDLAGRDRVAIGRLPG